MTIFILSILVLSAGISAIPASAADSPPTAQSFFEKGLRAQSGGQWAEAERDFRKALELDPANPNIHFELANFYAARFDKSRISVLDPGPTEMLNAAARELGQAVMLKPDFLAAYYNLGIVHSRLRRFEEAREDFKRMLELDPGQTNARLQIGAIYEQQGFYDEAESVYREAQERDFGNADVHAALEELPRNREVARQRASARNLPGPLDQLPPHPSSDGLNQPLALNRNQAIAQVAPQLGSWLMQQWMQRRGDSENK